MVYKVMFRNNKAVSAILTCGLQHGDVGLGADKETVHWLAIECENEAIAVEIASATVKMLWPTL